MDAAAGQASVYNKVQFLKLSLHHTLYPP